MMSPGFLMTRMMMWSCAYLLPMILHQGLGALCWHSPISAQPYLFAEERGYSCGVGVNFHVSVHMPPSFAWHGHCSNRSSTPQCPTAPVWADPVFWLCHHCHAHALLDVLTHMEFAGPDCHTVTRKQKREVHSRSWHTAQQRPGCHLQRDVLTVCPKSGLTPGPGTGQSMFG